MIDVAIEYPFLFLKLKAKGSVPASWAEVNEAQFIAISRTINGAEADFRFLSILTGVKERLLKKLSSYALLKLSQQIDFVGKAGNYHDSFIIKNIQVFRMIYSAPNTKLEGLTFGQFIFCDSYYNDWVSTKKDIALNNFVASLYRHAGEMFDNKDIPYRSWKIKNVDMDIRMAITFNWSLVMAWLGKAYPLIFREPTEKEPTTESETTAGAKQSPWIKLFESLVGDDLINRDKYAELPVHTVFRHLTKKYKENAQRK